MDPLRYLFQRWWRGQRGAIGRYEVSDEDLDDIEAARSKKNKSGA